MKIPATITERSINVVIDGRMKTIPKGHVNFKRVEKILRDINQLETQPTNWRDAFRSRAHALHNAEKKLRKLLDVPLYIEKATAGRVKVTDKGVMFNDVEVHNAISEQIMRLLHAGQDVRPLATFMDRLMSNPIDGVREDLYAWITSGDMTFTPDGCFLAFKKVKANYASGHLKPDGTELFNHIGAIVSMPREEVETDRNHTCSQGLHFCSWQYLPAFGVGGESKVLLVKIAPEDVVAIPTDYNRSKGRTWKYEVVGEVPEDECEHLFKDRPLVSGAVNDPLGEVDFDDDIDFDDDEDDYDDWTPEPDLHDDYENTREDALVEFGLEDFGPVTDLDGDESKQFYNSGYKAGRMDSEENKPPSWTQTTVHDDFDQGYVDGYAEAAEEKSDDLAEPIAKLEEHRSSLAIENGRLVPVYHNGKIVRYEILDD